MAIDVLVIAIDVISVPDISHHNPLFCLLFVLQVIMHDQHRKGLSL